MGICGVEGCSKQCGKGRRKYCEGHYLSVGLSPESREKRRKTTREWRRKNAAKIRAQLREYYKANPERWAEERARRKADGRQGEQLVRYGLTIAAFDRLLEEQRGVCAICKKPEKQRMYGKVKKLAVDHCHNSAKIRGLLCSNCNLMVGLSQDNAETLRAAAAYLER